MSASSPPGVVQKLREIDARVFRGQVTREEITVPQPDGSRKIYLEIKTPLRENGISGHVIGLLGISTDITAAKEAEQAIRESESRFRQIADSIQDVFWIRDVASGTVLYVSPAYEKIWGKPVAEVMEHPTAWFDSILEEDRPALTRCLDGAGNETGWEVNYRIHRPDGSTRWIHERALPIRNEAGETYRIAGVASDITENKRMEAQLLRSQRMESIGTLAGGIAHDLNNILAPITISTGLLKSGETDEERLTMLATIEASALRGAQLIRQVLSFARGQEGKPIPINLRHLVAEIGKIVHDVFPKDIEFKTETVSGLWTVEADPTQIHQVLMNLCVNARDAMAHGGILTISLRNQEIDEVYARMNPDARPGQYVVVSVRDTGTGIPAGIREKIFDPFFTTKEVGKGTGLGLSTALSLVRSHKGFIHLYSDPGKGSTFQVYLPASPDATPESLKPASEIPVRRGNGELILVVDDEPAIRDVCRKTLEDSGYRVADAANGAEAVALFASRRNEVALVLTDMAMPVMDGASTIQALKAIDPGVRIIASTGLAAEADTNRALGAGVRQFMAKPYTAEGLLQAVARTLAGPRTPPE